MNAGPSRRAALVAGAVVGVGTAGLAAAGPARAASTNAASTNAASTNAVSGSPAPATARDPGPLTVFAEPFGTTAGGEKVQRWLFGNDVLGVAMLTYGATIQGIRAVDAHGGRADVALGLRTLQEYETVSPYFGATIGRYANRIADGRFTLDGKTYQIPINNAPNALHGGPKGFNTRVWSAAAIRRPHEVGVRFGLVSPDGDQGFPGRLSVTVEYTVSDRAVLDIRYRATTDKPTVINLTNHTYFNLAGEDSGDIYDHRLMMRADQFTPIDATSIPLGPQRDVAGTPFDFRSPHAIGARIRTSTTQILNALGYDHNWVFNRGIDRASTPVITVTEPTSGRILDCYTDQPGVQFYSGNFLNGALVGPGGKTYRQGAGFTLETQHFPDSPNEPSYPSTVLRPGQTFSSRTAYRFRTS